MQQHRLLVSLIIWAALLAAADAHAQAIVDGQPSVLRDDKGQSNYVYDLKLLIKKSKDNIKTVNDKIKEQAVIKRNQQREEKAREYYQQALKLQEEGRLEEARQLFDRAIRITEHPEMKYYIKESERRSRLQEAALERQEQDQERRLSQDQKLLMDRADSLYQEAVSLYKQQKFREAKDEFQLVEEMYPDFKAVRSYLQILEQDIIQSEQLGMKEQKKEIERQQKEEEIARLREKELWRKEIERKEEERKAQLRKQAQTVYDEAVRLYEERKYMAAREKFQEVEWVVPDFKATRAYMTRIENDVQDEKKQISLERQRELEKQRWQEVLDQKKEEESRRKAMELREQEKLAQVRDQAEFVYQAAVALFEKELFAQSRDKFQEVEGVYPDYKSTRSYLKRIDQASRTSAEREAQKIKADQERKAWEEELARRKEEKESFRQAISEADDAYQDAIRLYQTSRLIEAKEKFLEVDGRVPDYKSTRSYLKRIDEDIELLVKTQRSQEALAAQREELEQMRMMRAKAEAVYNEALAAYDIKDFVTAKAKFRESEGIFPDLKKTKYYLNRIDEDIHTAEAAKARAERERQAAAAYAQALAFYQAGQFEEAKKKFIDVESAVSSYKQTPDYLGRIDDDILRKKQADLERAREAQVSLVYNQAKALYNNGELADAKDKFLQVEVIYPGYKETTRILGVIDLQIEKQKKEAAYRKRQEEAEQLYTQAIGLYQAGDYAAAKEKFIKVEVASPDYKDSLKYLARLDSDIVRKNRDEDLKARAQDAEPLYAQGIALYKEADFVEARKKFIQVQAVLPGYKDVGVYLVRIEKDIRDQEVRVAEQEKRRRADALYGEAVQLYVNRKFVEAKTRFFELTGIDPNYKNVRSYLARIDDDIRQEAQKQRQAAVEQQAAEPYAQAVTLYHDRDFEGARVKFLDVAKISPDYKKTRSYLSRIDDDIRSQRKEEDRQRVAGAELVYKEAVALMAAGRNGEAAEKFKAVETVYPDYKAVRANLEKLGKVTAPAADKVQPRAVAAPVSDADDARLVEAYKKAVQLFKDKKYDQARAQFDAVAGMKPGYRSTQQYIDSISKIQQVAASVPVTAGPSVPPPASSLAVERLQEARKIEARAAAQEILPSTRIDPVSPEEIRTIEALAARSGALYEQIRSLSEDKELSGAARTFAKVDRVIESLEVEQRRIAAELARQKRQEERQTARAKRQEQQEVLRQARLSAEHADALKRKEQDKAQEEAQVHQQGIEKERAELRKKERMELERLRDQQREAQLKSEILYQQAQGFLRKKDYAAARERLTDLTRIVPEYKDASRLLLIIERGEDEVKLTQQEASDRDAVRILAEKATAINVQVLELSQKREYAAVEARFNDLESILKEIKIVKARMIERREQFSARWEKKEQVRSAEAKKRMPPKASRDGDLVPARQKALSLFREGEQFYALGKFAEARVKFVEAAQTDPTYKAAMSYVNRLDRILARKDFEAIRKDQGPDEAAADVPVPASAVDMTDLQRAARVREEGDGLYRARRYREARIKFEELVQVGADADKRYAKRRLGSIDEALEKEKQDEESQKRVQQQRLIEERRARARLQWERDRNEQERERRKVRELAERQKELDIRRQQQLRAIERENFDQRRNMIDLENREFARSALSARQERAKFMQEPGRERPSKDVKVAQNKVKEEREGAARIAAEVRPEPTGVALEQAAAEKIGEEPGLAAEKAVRDDARVQVRTQSRVEQQRRRLEQLETREQRLERERFLKQQQKADSESKAEVQRRKVVEAQVLARRGVEDREAQQKEFIRRNQEAVEAILKEEPLPVPVSESNSSSVLEEDPSSVLLRQAIAEEKRRLEEQRAAIRKEFEDGVERVYVEAVALFKKKMYPEARQNFEQVNGLIKGYKRTAQYLKDLDRVTPPPLFHSP